MQPIDCCQSGQRPEPDQRATTGADRASKPGTFSAEAGETPAAGRLQAFFGGGVMTRRLPLCLALVLASCASPRGVPVPDPRPVPQAAPPAAPPRAEPKAPHAGTDRRIARDTVHADSVVLASHA